MDILQSFCALCLLVLAGKYLRVRIPLFQRLYLPSAVIGGVLGLIIIQVLGGWIPDAWTAGWVRLPGLLINVVFAALFLGVAIPPLAEIWRRSGPQLAYGQIVAWGQYVVGIGLVLVLLRPLLGTSPLFGVIVPVGFEGGHGTASGLAETFQKLAWPEGADYALASATAGMISAIVVGMCLVNWAVRRGVVSHVRRIEDMSETERAGVYRPDNRPSAGRQTVMPDSIDSLTLHLAFIGLAILIAIGIKLGLSAAESRIPGLRSQEIMRAFPLFPLSMIGGLIVQISLGKCSANPPIDRELTLRLSGLALDFLVVAAVSTIRMEVIMEGWLPFLVIILGGVAWNVFCVMVLARRLLPDAWFERAMAEMGQSMGVTATGLLFLRVLDPECRTEATSAFGYKQLLHEPFMGGGIWTSAAVLLVYRQGAPFVLAVSVAAIAVWVVVWFLLLRPRK